MRDQAGIQDVQDPDKPENGPEKETTDAPGKRPAKRRHILLRIDSWIDSTVWNAGFRAAEIWEDTTIFFRRFRVRGWKRMVFELAGEGLTLGRRDGRSELYICSTMGGPKQLGQVWRYRPSPREGSPGEVGQPATLQLFVESEDSSRLKNCDNVTVAPWGGLILCEDGPDNQPQYLRGVTPQGKVYDLAANGHSEFAGATFSPDGTTLFGVGRDRNIVAASLKAVTSAANRLLAS